MEPQRSRFGKKLTKDAEGYMQSLEVDLEMFFQDIWGSEAHAIMLARQGIISKKDLKVILKWLERAKSDYESGKFKFDPAMEDVHMNVESYLIKNAGIEVGGKLHTARSRNDQVVTDSKLYLREQIIEIEELLIGLQSTLLALAKKNLDTVMPGYTHTQYAQPVTLAYWLTGYASMLNRDLKRLQDAYSTLNSNPLGACALAGTSLPIDRKLTTKLLGFDTVQEHALDAVSSRDFMLETLSALAILMSNISRLSADLIYWSSYEFGFVELDDSYTTGSSIMPQKKNPCAAELARSKTGTVYGALIQLLTTMKGIPMGYNRDLQEDKAPVWSAIKTSKSTLAVMNGMLKTAKFDKVRMAKRAGANFTTATELANYLVVEKGLSFRQSHRIVGNIVMRLIGAGKDFDDLIAVKGILKKSGLEIPMAAIERLLDPKNAIISYNSQGGTSPKEVARMIKKLEGSTRRYASSVKGRKTKIQKSRKLTETLVSRVLKGDDLSSVSI